MNRVITINLNGNAYQLEDSGYEALRTYLDTASRRLEGNPDKDEIIADIEQSIADKFRARLNANKTVVITREVEEVLKEMGPVQEVNGRETDSSTGSASNFSSAPNAKTGTTDKESSEKNAGPAKRFYRVWDGAMLAGVCNGIAAYFNIDVTFVRVLFVVLTMFVGTGALLYLIMAFIVPAANTPTEKAAAFGAAATAQEFIRRAKSGYYESMKAFNNQDARKEWKRKFKRDMRGWQQNFQHEMNQHSRHWQHQWSRQNYMGGGAGPFMSLISVLITVLGVYALYSLVTSHAVFGISLPADIPLWVGIIALFVMWQLIAWPFKVMQWQACGRGACCGSCGGSGGFIMGLCFMVAMVWLLDHFVPQFHEFLEALPPLASSGRGLRAMLAGEKVVRSGEGMERGVY